MVVPIKSTVVPKDLIAELRTLGWDIREMPGVTHDLHVQDPAGVLALLRDVLGLTPASPRGRWAIVDAVDVA